MRSTLLMFGVLLATGCASSRTGDLPLESTRARMLRGPDGQIAVVETPRGNRQVQIQLANLAPPQAYDRSASTFVVWLVPVRGVPIRAGEIQYDRRARYGSATVLTPYDRFHVVVTAEPPDPSLDAPGANVVVDRAIAS